VPSSPLRGLLAAVAAFTVGLLLGQWGPDAAWRLLLTFCFFCALILLSRRISHQAQIVALILLFLLIGWSRGAPEDISVQPDEAARFTGRVKLPVESFEGSTRIRLDRITWEMGERVGRVNQGALVTLQRDPGVNPGDRVELVGRLEQLSGVRNPGGFDAQAYWRLRGVGYRIIKVESVQITRTAARWSPLSLYGRMQKGIRRTLEEASTPQTFPLATALILGDRTNWDDSLRDQISRSGLMHIFAISGLHIGVLLLLLKHMLSLFPLTPRRRELIAMMLIWLIIPLTGLNPPVIRAAVMLSLYVLGRQFQRMNRPSYAILLAWLLLTTLQPASLKDAGFQLSFAGTAGALFAAARFDRIEAIATSRRIDGIRHRIRSWLAGFYLLLMISLGAWLATAPIVVFHFGILPWFAPLISLPAAGLLYLILAAAWLAVLTSPIHAISILFAESLHLLLSLLHKIALTGAASLPVGTHIPVSMVLPMTLIAVVFALFARKIERAPVAGWSMSLIAAACILIYATLWMPSQQVRLLAVDVGQGDGFLLRRGARTVLIDGGKPNVDAVPRLLRQSGIDTLSLMILTHGDADHAGAAARIATEYPVRAALIGPGTERDREGRAAILALQQQGTPVYIGAKGTRVNLGKLGNLTLLSPDSALRTLARISDNDLSLVTLWEVNDTKALFPGDATQRAERAILQRTAIPEVDLLMAGHHGSRYSNSEPWLHALQPRTILVSCGRGNSYGHPSPYMLDRARAMSIPVLRTDLHGAYLLEPRQGRFLIRSSSFWW